MTIVTQPLGGVTTVVVGLAVATALIVLAVVALRNPLLPAWLRSESTGLTACLFLTMFAASVSATAVVGFVRFGTRVVVGIALTVAVVLAAAYLVCVLGRVG